MGKLNIILTKFIIYGLIGMLCMECTPSPRYRSNSKPSPTATKKQKQKNKKHNKKKKNNKSTFDKSKKVFRGISSYYGPKFHGKLTAN